MVYLPKGSGVRFIFIISIMNPFIDDLHRPAVTQNQLIFQASLPEVTQKQTLYSAEAWALLRHSRRINPPFFFFNIYFCFWIPIKIPLDKICRKLVFMMKAQKEKHSNMKNDLSPWISILFVWEKICKTSKATFINERHSVKSQDMKKFQRALEHWTLEFLKLGNSSQTSGEYQS